MVNHKSSNLNFYMSYKVIFWLIIMTVMFFTFYVRILTLSCCQLQKHDLPKRVFYVQSLMKQHYIYKFIESIFFIDLSVFIVS